MATELTRMWINQPSTLQPHHALHGTNVLAVPEYGDTMRIYFLSGNTISMQVSRLALSKGWLPSNEANLKSPKQDSVVEVVTGLHKALSRMIDLHNPDSIEAEWLSHSNELVRDLTGKDIQA